MRNRTLPVVLRITVTIIALAFVSEARAQKYSFSTVYSFKSIGGSRRNSAVLRKISAQEIKRIGTGSS